MLTLDKGYREQYPWFKYQTFIAVVIGVSTLSLIVVSSMLYYYDVIPAYICILFNAFLFGFFHELEHDLFHKLYFKHYPVARNIVLFILWLLKPNTINPWVRQQIHLQHHRVSGTKDDIEERLIGNGLPFNFLRVLIACDQFFTMTQFKKLSAEANGFSVRKILLSTFPFMLLFTMTWVLWSSYYFIELFNFYLGTNWMTFKIIYEHINLLNLIMVIYIVPSMLRQASLILISSNIHYYGNVTHLIEQVQVLTKWYFLPLQLFCCFFGETHAMHHIFIKQPFYLRHVMRKECHTIMRKCGVQFNDIHSFKRKNLYPSIYTDKDN